MIKTRFCPSPTGYMHLGNARTALLSALLGWQQGGKFLVRIEDTDRTRSKQVFTDAICHDLHWMELHWQEGIEVGGPEEPYFQSERKPIYDKYYQQLIDNQRAYPCFCSPEQLALSRKIQRTQGKAPRYAGTCRNLTAAEIAEKRKKNIPETLRFNVTTDQIISFTDFVKGEQRFQSNDIGDFIIRRADGTSAFFFCNAIDDAVMGITHVLRGEDHLTNTPRQIMILEALRLSIPQYGHVALILGNDNAPLSKRNGSLSIHELQEQGYLAIAVNNYLARLGHHYQQEELLTINDLAKYFRIEALSKSPAKFDINHLHYWQKLAIHHLDQKIFWQAIAPFCEAIVPKNKTAAFVDAVQQNITFARESKEWAECFFTDKLNFSAEQIAILQLAGKKFFTTAIDIVNQGEMLSLPKLLKEHLQINGKALFLPLRMSLTGKEHGPELIKIITVLDKDLLIARFNQALSLC